MPTDQTTLHVLAVILLATVIRSAFGFGEALVAVPLLALMIPIEVATPLAVLISVTVAGVILARVAAVTRYYLISLPVVLVAILLGRALNQRLDGKRFIVYVHVGLVVIGGLLLIQSASGWGHS
jgi:uncharacterized membrane protein YfcA